jgi:uncharacterized protein YdhG (YjbR/CyaY superfamily)
MTTKTPGTVDEYLAGITSDQVRASLVQLRHAIREAVPEAVEVISYGIPTYKFHGYIASFAAYKKHCSFFAGHTAAAFTDELKPYKVLKGTVQFSNDKPLPDSLVKRMVRARAQENMAGLSHSTKTFVIEGDSGS